ncbi:hypothetical protein ACQKLP_24740 [Chitinophaga sp. NPDC101104]|uniref:hypothetical protein n=1 Tax=Chitinophaga sp. NPDC101104 TaxID=3390561 RepID=UPI003CFD7D7C
MTKENACFVFNRTENRGTGSQFPGESLSDEAERSGWASKTWQADRPGYHSPMKPLYKDAFGTEFGLVRFLRNGHNRVTGLEVTSGRARKVPFTKAK